MKRKGERTNEEKRRDEEACSYFLHAHAPPLNYPDKSVQAKGILPASLYLRVGVPTAYRKAGSRRQRLATFDSARETREPQEAREDFFGRLKDHL
ncbi:MAG: hypothetical protein R6U66_00015 [Bacteroidales bacterium]